ncbi:MAG: cell wall hydrolase [Asticcacaulis sp.]
MKRAAKARTACAPSPRSSSTASAILPTPRRSAAWVYQGAYLRTSCQFSFTCNGAMARPVEAWAWRRAKQVADAALGGYVMAAVGSATHFHTTSVAPDWGGNMVEVATIGQHIFYQFRGRGAHIGNGDSVMPSTKCRRCSTRSTPRRPDGGSLTPDVTQASLTDAPAPAMQPTTIAPTGEARTRLIRH